MVAICGLDDCGNILFSDDEKASGICRWCETGDVAVPRAKFHRLTAALAASEATVAGLRIDLCNALADRDTTRARLAERDATIAGLKGRVEGYQVACREAGKTIAAQAGRIAEQVAVKIRLVRDLVCAWDAAGWLQSTMADRLSEMKVTNPVRPGTTWLVNDVQWVLDEVADKYDPRDAAMGAPRGAEGG